MFPFHGESPQVCQVEQSELEPNILCVVLVITEAQQCIQTATQFHCFSQSFQTAKRLFVTCG